MLRSVLLVPSLAFALGKSECELADGCDDTTSLLSLRGVHRHLSSDTVDQCCFDQCGQCNPPDHSFCNTKDVCERQQGDDGCSGKWLTCPVEPESPTPAPTTVAPTPVGDVEQCCFHACGQCTAPDHYCGSEDVCQRATDDNGGCAGTWLSCPATALIMEHAIEQQPATTDAPAEDKTVGQCCYDKCGQCNPPDHSFCNTKDVCERMQGDDGCSGKWLECPVEPAPAPTPEAPAPTPSSDDEVEQCCYDVCGQCNPPDHYCGNQDVCERAQEDNGGCAGKWLSCPAASLIAEVVEEHPKVEPAVEQCCYDVCGQCNSPDHYCGSQDVCERAQEDNGGCAGKWLSCPAASLIAEVVEEHPTVEPAVEQCCYDVCGQCNSPDHYCGSQDVCERAQEDNGGCAGKWLTCPLK